MRRRCRAARGCGRRSPPPGSCSSSSRSSGPRCCTGGRRMRSDRRWLELLRSQGLGVTCGLATVVLLAVGSFVLDATREGASAGIAMDDLPPFVERPALAHPWMYLLAPVLALYALNTLLATWYSVARKVRSGVRSPSAHGP